LTAGGLYENHQLTHPKPIAAKRLRSTSRHRTTHVTRPEIREHLASLTRQAGCLASPLDKKMNQKFKVILVIHSLLALIINSSAIGQEVTSNMTDAEFRQYLENRKGDISRKDHLFGLIDALRSEENLNEKRQVDIVFTLLDTYVPRESMYAWKGDTFLDLNDMLEYLLTREQAELKTWLLDREKIIFDTSTRGYRLQIKESTYLKFEDRGIRSLSVNRLFDAFRNEISRREEQFDIQEIKIVKAHYYQEWMALCLYSDENDALRMACMISEGAFVHDIIKEELGF
jgi:hypothetical protein